MSDRFSVLENRPERGAGPLTPAAQRRLDTVADIERRNQSNSGGSSQVTVAQTPTGLTQNQFDSLATGQNNLGAGIQDLSSGLMSFEDFSRGRFDTIGRDILGLQDETLGQFDVTQQALRDIGGAQTAGFEAAGRALADQTQQMNQGFTGLTQDVAGVGSQVAGVGQAVDQGFAGVGDQFVAMGSTLADLGSDVGQGFSTLGQQVGTGFSDLGTSMADQFSAAEQARMQGFQGLSDQVGTGFAGQADFLTNMSANVLGGQAGIQDALTSQQNALTAFYGDLAQGQQGISQQVGGVQTGLTDFTTQYGRDTSLAEQDRANMMTALGNQTGRIRDDITNLGVARAAADQNLMRSVSGVGGQVDQLGLDTTRMMSSAERQREQVQGDFSQRIERVRDLLRTTGDNLEQTTRQQYTDLANSFDLQGNLISNAVDDQGIRITRAVDQQGNLLINRFDQNGSLISRNLLSIPEMLNQASVMQQQLGVAPVPQVGMDMPQQQMTQGLMGTPVPFAETA